MLARIEEAISWGLHLLKSEITAGLLAAMHRKVYMGTFLNKQTDPLGAGLLKITFSRAETKVQLC